MYYRSIIFLGTDCFLYVWPAVPRNASRISPDVAPGLIDGDFSDDGHAHIVKSQGLYRRCCAAASSSPRAVLPGDRLRLQGGGIWGAGGGKAGEELVAGTDVRAAERARLAGEEALVEVVGVEEVEVADLPALAAQDAAEMLGRNGPAGRVAGGGHAELRHPGVVEAQITDDGARWRPSGSSICRRRRDGLGLQSGVYVQSLLPIISPPP